MAFKSYREESKTNWGTTESGNLNKDQIQLGCLLRIADAAEAMAKNHVDLVSERDTYERLYRKADADRDRLRRSNAALRGHIKRLRRNST